MTFKSLRTLAFGLLLLMSATAGAQVLREAQHGFNPRDLVVGTTTSAQSFAIITSDGSHHVTLVHDGIVSKVDVGSRSWGACLVDPTTAVVSLLDVDGIAVFRQNGSGQFALEDVHAVAGASLLHSRRVLAVPGTRRVLVANAGAAPTGAEAWQNAVYELEIPTAPGAPTLRRTFVTEAEPNALALSPDGKRLFVGTLRGALGGDGVTTNESPLATGLYDGGSIVMYDFFKTATTPLVRFAIGSPVRDLAVWNAPGTGELVYRLFATHVGAGAAGEDPDHGGRRIPNVITEIELGLFDNVAQTRRDIVLGHCPDGEGGAGCADVHVVPEDLLVVDNDGGQDLYVSFSGSGNVAVLDLDVDGSIVTDAASPTVDLTSSAFGGGNARVLAATGWNDQTQRYDPSDATTNDAGFLLYRAHAGHVTTIDVGDANGIDGSSNPRGMAYDVDRGEISVVARHSQRVDHLDVATRTASTRPSWITFTWGASEPDWFVQMRRFFARGGAFDFRESGAGAALLVDNLSCGTCHPNAMTDGKVRDTKTRQMLNIGGRTTRLPVAVPSVLDVGLTEWLFFEGLHTVVDDGIDNPSCIYCNGNDFFLDTVDFTEELRSAVAPAAPQGNLSEKAQAGRWWFDQMNCSRCHNGPVASFPRALITTVTPATGPLTLGDPASERMLHDGSQVFISGVDGGGISPETDFSLRNMTVVGTRPGTTPIDDPNVPGIAPGPPGVNTPALADAWHNAPYLHDGRYRDLEEVLHHTWLVDGDRAAPHWAGIVADNYENAVEPATAVTNRGIPVADLDFDFQTHQHERPSSLTPSVHAFLSSRPSVDGAGSALDDLLAFLGSPSAATDLCDPNVEEAATISGLRVLPSGHDEYTVFFETAMPTRCSIVLRLASGSVIWSRSFLDAPIAYAHQSPKIQVPPRERYVVEVSTFRPEGVCDSGALETASFAWKDIGIGVLRRDAADGVPTRTSIASIQPNPFNPRTTIAFGVPREAHTELVVFDARGRTVRTLVNETLPAGSRSVVWDGLDEAGSPVASGVYHVRIRTGDDSDVRRAILVR